MIILRKIMLQRHGTRLHLPRKRPVRLRPLAHLQKLVLLQRLVRVLVPQAAEVVARDRIHDGIVLVAADVAVMVENRVVGAPGMDADEAVDKPRNVDDASRQTQAAERVAEVGGVGGEQEPADAQPRRAPLVHPIRAEVGDGVLVGRGMAGEEGRELGLLAGEVLVSRQARDVAVGDAPKGVAA